LQLLWLICIMTVSNNGGKIMNNQDKKKLKNKSDIQKFKDNYFNFYDDVKHQTKNKDIEW